MHGREVGNVQSAVDDRFDRGPTRVEGNLILT